MRVQSRSPVLKGQVANGEDRFWQGPKWNDGYAFGNEDQRGVLAISFMRSLARGWRPAPVLSKSLHFLQHPRTFASELARCVFILLSSDLSYLIETPQ